MRQRPGRNRPGRLSSRYVYGKGSSRMSADPEAAATLHQATLVFAHSAPDAGVLTRVERPLEALGGHGAALADRLRLLNLQHGGAGGPNREEQLRVLVAAEGMVAPVRHGGNTPCFFADRCW